MENDLAFSNRPSVTLLIQLQILLKTEWTVSNPPKHKWKFSTALLRQWKARKKDFRVEFDKSEKVNTHLFETLLALQSPIQNKL